MSLRVLARRLSVLARYDDSIAAGRLKPDPVQRAAAAELARLHEQVNVYASTLERYERELRDWNAVRRRHEDRQRQLEAEAAAAEARRPALVKWAAAAMQRFSPPPAPPPSKHQLAKQYGRQVPKPKPREVTVEAPPAPPEEEDELERLERAHEENRRRAAQIRAELLL